MTEQDLLVQPPADYMNEAQQAFFRERLLAQRDDLQARIEAEFIVLREQEPNSDLADIGSAEEQRQWQLRLLEREASWCAQGRPRPTAFGHRVMGVQAFGVDDLQVKGLHRIQTF